MKKRLFIWISAFTVLAAVSFTFTRCTADNEDLAQMDALAIQDRTAAPAQSMCDCINLQFPASKLSATEKEAILFMREEEKLARDVYMAMHQRWKTQIFDNIRESEQRHMDAILCLINKYQLQDPVGSNQPGVFQNADLQKLYHELLNRGKSSRQEALLVGAEIEDLDIADLIAREKDIDNKDVLAVFGELEKGSRNHLRAFYRNLQNSGVTYAPKYIPEALFQDIINTPRETGSSMCKISPEPANGYCGGGGNGNGPGKGNCRNGYGPGPNNNGN